MSANLSTMFTTDPRDPYGTRQQYSDALTKLGTPEAKVLKAQLQAEGLLLAEPDADGETKAVKAARLAKLKKAKAMHQAELSRINAELAKGDEDSQMMGVPDGEDSEASISDGNGYEDSDVYDTQDGDPNDWKENSMNRSQPTLRPGKATSSTPTASETFSTRSTVSMGEGKDVVAQAKRLAEVHGLDWTDLRSRERAFAMALRKN